MKNETKPLPTKWVVRGLIVLVLVLSLLTGYLEADRGLLQKQLRGVRVVLEACQTQLTASY